MEEINTSPLPEEEKVIKDLAFYRRVVNSIATVGVNNVYGFEHLSMSRNQLNYCHSYYLNTYRRVIFAEELMFIDGYCELLRSSPRSIAVDELLLNDGYIAQAYADLMSRRRALVPDYNTHPTVAELLDVTAESVKLKMSPVFRYSELDVFSSDSDRSASLKCLAGGCEPLVCRNGVCVGRKLATKEPRGRHCVAVIYANADSRDDAYAEFLSSNTAMLSSAVIELCKTEDIFARLVDRYDGFSVNTSTLPLPKEGRYANQVLQYNEIFLIELAGAFLTRELFGESAILVSGDKKTVKKLCKLASGLGLSHFNGIQSNEKLKKASSDSSTPVVVKIRSSLYRIIAELDNNRRVKIPDHDITSHLISDVIPEAECIYESGTDHVYSATNEISDALPFHSAIYTLLSPLLAAAERGVNLKNGELSLSARISLSFSDESSSANSIAALLGICKVQTALSIPLENTHLELTESEKTGITATVHAFSDSPAALDLSAENAKGFLLSIANPDGIPDFDTLERLISGAEG